MYDVIVAIDGPIAMNECIGPEGHCSRAHSCAAHRVWGVAQSQVVGILKAAEIGALVVERIVQAHLRTMARLNVSYDLLTYEGDILRLKFWAQAFDVLKEKGAVYLATEGRLAGCWVMPIQEQLGEAAEEGEDEREKVIVRSNGVVTYVGKDIAYQFWKLGLLGRDFQYRVFDTRPQGPLWATCAADGRSDHPSFGGATAADGEDSPVPRALDFSVSSGAAKAKAKAKNGSRKPKSSAPAATARP